jgi:hypothetical protein
MKYERFSEIWNKYMPKDMVFMASKETTEALIEYGQGNKAKVNKVRRLLGRN